jgi:hypothetical protein
VKVSKSNVYLFQLQASVLGTKGIESGLLATPNTMDYLPPRSVQGTKKLMEGHRKGRTKPSNLREQVDPQTMAMYPTPSASCNMDVVAPPETVKKNSTGWSVTRVGTGRVFGAKLNDVMNKIEKDKMFPTPKQRDYKDAAYQPTWKDSLEKNLPRTVLKDNKPGGRLNPTFVEFLMGFPMNWTKIDPTE